MGGRRIFEPKGTDPPEQGPQQQLSVRSLHTKTVPRRSGHDPRRVPRGRQLNKSEHKHS